MPHSDFLRLVDPNEPVFSILICHFFATQTFMLPILAQEWTNGFGPVPEKENLRTLTKLSQLISACKLRLPRDMRRHLGWPELVQTMMLEGRFWDNLFEGEAPPLARYPGS